MFLAKHWGAEVVASDISPIAIDAIRKNAAANEVDLKVVQSDLFEEIDEKDFDLIIFNAPLIDKAPENNVERYSLCDPGGQITRAYLQDAGAFLKRTGMAIVSISSNSAYEALDDIELRMKIVGFELSYSGFWWAIVGAEL